MRRRNSRRNASSEAKAESDTEREESTVATTEETPIVETLVSGRQKRSTAGNRLAHLLDKEADKDDDLVLLFQEPEDDVEFEIEENAMLSDVQFSSSEDEDEGGGGEVGADGQPKEDLSGEVELQRELRAEKKAQKRKMQELFVKPPKSSQQKKKVQIIENENGAERSTPTESSALTRVRKKSERISWMPTDGPVRSSSRKQTLQNRELIHQRLIESEKRRRETIALMEKAAAKKAKDAKKVMSQAERLEEAKKTEMLNGKSLNKWEEAEAQRAEQQRAKLAALQNRQMEGPYIKFWSGRGEWDQHGKLKRVGKLLVEEIEEDKKPKEKEKRARGRPAKLHVDTKEAEQSAGSTTITQATTPVLSTVANNSPIDAPLHVPPQQVCPSPIEPPKRVMPSIMELTSDATLTHTPSPSAPHTLPPRTNSSGPRLLLDGLLYYASLPLPDAQSHLHPRSAPLPSGLGRSAQAEPIATNSLPESSSAPKPKLSYSTRNLIILEKFDQLKVQDRQSISKTLFTEEPIRKQKVPYEMCMMTSEVARFRDPSTGTPYANIWAYKQLQKVKNDQLQWSSLLGSFVGSSTAAKGVPEEFYL